MKKIKKTTKGKRGKLVNINNRISVLKKQEENINRRLDLLENQREKLFIELKYPRGIEEKNAIIFNIEMNKMDYGMLLRKFEKINTKIREAKMKKCILMSN